MRPLSFSLRTVVGLGNNRYVINKFKDFVASVKTKFRRAPKGESLDLEDSSTSSRPGFDAKKIIGAITVFLASLSKKTGLTERMQKGNWAALPDKLLAKESFTTHHRVFLAALLLVLAYSGGKLTALILRGRPEFTAASVARLGSRPHEFDAVSLGQVRNSDPFKTGGGPNRPVVADKDCDEASVSSNLPIKLVNTVVLQDSVKSIASVQVRSGRDLKEFHEGDSVEGMAKIFHISRLELIIKNLETGACELVAGDKKDEPNPIALMSNSAGQAFKAQQKIKGIENVGNKYTISKDLLNEKLKDISQVLTQARAIKLQNPDGTLAFKITEIEPGGIFAYLGIQNDDVITSIDGRPITDLNEVMSLFGRLKTVDKLRLGVRREGDESELDYTMKQ